MRIAAAQMSKEEPLEDNERGVVVMTASIAAFEGMIGQAAYSAAKGGIVGMTLPAARDLAAIGVRVVTIAPGTFATPAYRMMPEDRVKALEELNPFPKRMGKPDEYGALVEHICTNTMLNGEVIRIDGAVRFPPKSGSSLRQGTSARNATARRREVGELACVRAVHGVAGVAEHHDVGIEQRRETVGRLEVPRRGVDAATDEAGHDHVGEVERCALHEREVARHRDLVGGTLLGRTTGHAVVPTLQHRLEVE